MKFSNVVQFHEAAVETEKRLKLLNAYVNDIRNDVMGVILVGSLAYAPYEGVNKKSDIDLIVVYNDIKTSAKDYFFEHDYLLAESYDGYLAKRNKNLDHKPDIESKNQHGLDISIHKLNYSALQKISYGNYETLAYYRQDTKGATYYSKDFDGNVFPFKPECCKVFDDKGERRIDSVAFQSPDGNYVIGNDMDKLLSHAQVLLDTDGKLAHAIDQTWLNVTKKLVEHRRKHNQKIDPNNEDIGPLLFRYDRFSEKAKAEVKRRTVDGVKQALGHDKTDTSILIKQGRGSM